MKNIYELLKKEDFDYVNVYERFVGDEELFSFCLDDFLNDETFIDLRKALKEEKFDDAFLLVHSLKGVGANLGLRKVYSLLSDMTEKLRANDYSGLEAKMSTIEKEVQRLKEIVEKSK